MARDDSVIAFLIAVCFFVFFFGCGGVLFFLNLFCAYALLVHYHQLQA